MGGGIEAHLSGPWTGKIEYLHVDLGSTTNVLTFPAIVGVTSLTTNTEMRADIIRAGLNYKFGWVR